MKYLIFLDIDGTLITHRGVAERTRNALEEAVKAGHWIFINTGRAKGNLPMHHLKDLPLSGIVAGLGSYIEMDDQVLYSAPLSADDIAFAMQLSKQTGIGIILECEDRLIDYRHGRPSHWPTSPYQTTDIDDFLARFSDVRVSKISFIEHLPDEIEQQLRSRMYVINHPTYAEAGSIGHTKASAMEMLQRHLEIDVSHVIAMGDSLNDVDMLRAAGIAVVMGDGHEQVKSLADFISIDAHLGGVGQAIEELVLKKQ